MQYESGKFLMNILQEFADMEPLGTFRFALAAIQAGRAVNLKIGISAGGGRILLVHLVGKRENLRYGNTGRQCKGSYAGPDRSYGPF